MDIPIINLDAHAVWHAIMQKKDATRTALTQLLRETAQTEGAQVDITLGGNTLTTSVAEMSGFLSQVSRDFCSLKLPGFIVVDRGIETGATHLASLTRVFSRIRLTRGPIVAGLALCFFGWDQLLNRGRMLDGVHQLFSA